MVLPSSSPQDPYFNVSTLRGVSLSQLQAYYLQLVNAIAVTSQPVGSSNTTSNTLFVSDVSQYQTGYIVKGCLFSSSFIGDATITNISSANSTITIQYTSQLFPAIPNNFYLSTVMLVGTKAAHTSASVSTTLTVTSSTQYGIGQLIHGHQLGIVGDALVIGVPNSTTISIQYNYQVFPGISSNTYLSFVPYIYSQAQFNDQQWLIAQLTGQTLSASQIETEFSFPGLFRISDYIGLSTQIAQKPIKWSQFYGITNDYFPYEVNPAQSSITTTQSVAQFIGGPESSITLFQSGWIQGNTVPYALQTSYTNCVGAAVINTVELHIGGQLIEVLTGEYIQNYMDMTTELQNKPALTVLYGKDDYSSIISPRTYFINLPFYFHRETGLCLPLVALYRQDVELYFTFNKFGSNYTVGADYTQFTMTSNKSSTVIWPNKILKGQDTAQLYLQGGTLTGNVFSGMEILVDLSSYGIDSNAVVLIDSSHPVTLNANLLTTIDGTQYLSGGSQSSEPKVYNSNLASSTSINLWVKFTPVSRTYYGGTYGGTILFLFPFVQPNNIQPFVQNNYNFMSVSVIAEYAYLTGPELNYFRTRKLTYLIGQIQLSKQTIPPGSTGGFFVLNFVNPVYMFQFFIRNDRNIDGNRIFLNQNIDLFNYRDNGLISMGLTFNGEDAFTTSAIDNVYLGSLEVFDKRTAPAYSQGQVSSNVFMYSFSLSPEAVSNPSGQVNMSRIKQQVLEVNFTPDNFYKKTFNIYALNYNLLRIENGLAGLLFNSSQ